MLSSKYSEILVQLADLNEQRRTFDVTADLRISGEANTQCESRQAIREVLESIQRHWTQFQETRSTIQDIVDDCTTKFRIDAAQFEDISSELPDLVVEHESGQELVDLFLLLGRWNDILKVLQSTLESCERAFTDVKKRDRSAGGGGSVIEQLEQMCITIAREVHTQHNFLTGIHELRNQFQQMRLRLENSVQNLSEQCDDALPPHVSPLLNKGTAQSTRNFRLVPPTPLLHLGAGQSDNDTQLEFQTQSDTLHHNNDNHLLGEEEIDNLLVDFRPLDDDANAQSPLLL